MHREAEINGGNVIVSRDPMGHLTRQALSPWEQKVLYNLGLLPL